MDFQIESKFKPAGDQPKAIKQLVQGLKNKEKFQTLLGVTGSGKTTEAITGPIPGPVSFA